MKRTIFDDIVEDKIKSWITWEDERLDEIQSKIRSVQ